jgi:transposase
MPNNQQTELLNKWEGHSGAEHDRDVNAALNILWWGLMATPNTAGMAGIDACGVSKPLVDEGHMTGFDKDTMKQEACGSSVHR